MQRYHLKRGRSPDISRIRALLETGFPVPVEQRADRLHLTYGAFESLDVWLEGSELCIETASARGAKDADVVDTNRRFRRFLEEATGYTAKQRQGMAKKEVQG